MSVPAKFRGIFPAFLACYDDAGNVSPERTAALAEYYLKLGIPGLYVCGSSGECMLQSVEERKLALEATMQAVGGKMTVIAHVAAPSTRDSIELARHAEKVGADAIAMVPGVYYGLSNKQVIRYWNDVLEATDNIPMMVYNIPQTTNGYNLPNEVFRTMLRNKRVIGVKNSSLLVQDVLRLRQVGGEDVAIFNGCDEQYLAGRALGASGGIGTCYNFMPELFLKLEELISTQQLDKAAAIQSEMTSIIYQACAMPSGANLVDFSKMALKRRGIECGRARLPMLPLADEDQDTFEAVCERIDSLTKHYCG